MQNVLLVCDRPNWAYDAIAKALVRHNDDPELTLDLFYLKGREAELKKLHRRYDVVFVLGWQLLGELRDGRVEPLLTFLDPKRTLTGIHSHHAWDGRVTTPDRDVIPPAALVGFLQRFAGVNAVSSRLHRLFAAAGLRGLAYTPNGVDTSIFRPTSEPGGAEPLRVGYSGSKKHDWRKGVTALIEPACDLPGIELRLAMPVEDHYVPLSEMPAFYNEIDVYVCASSSEASPLPLLEAAACGRPTISTRVGCADELIQDGVNGFLVDRTVVPIAEKVIQLRDDRAAVRRLGAANRRAVEAGWSWSDLAPIWLRFVRDALV
jgi:glycosyltransferase involved in cell wall biosynthesis